MKLNKKQLDVFYGIVTNARTARVFWEMLLGEGLSFGCGARDSECWSNEELADTNKGRVVLVQCLRQLSDVIENNPATLFPDCNDALKAKEKSAKSKAKK